MSDLRSGSSSSLTLPPWAKAGLVCIALGLWWAMSFEGTRSWGWDEATHAELPAVRMLLSLQAGDFAGFNRALQSCQQYPFGWPLVLAAVQALFGVSEFVCRMAGLAAWSLTLWGVFLLAQEVARAQRGEAHAPRPGDDLMPWLALGFAGLSPLALGYATSLFLEVPFTLCAVFALRAWLRRTTLRDQPGALRREVVAGCWLTAAFFTKFNYGLLLMFGCGLDALVALVLAKRAGQFWKNLHAIPFLCLPILLAAGWWLLLPLPYGFEQGAEHRRVMFEFLSSNQQMASTPWQQRVIFWSVFSAYTARLFLVQVLGCVISLRGLLAPGARLLWLVFLGAGLPVWTHNFHLDRFSIPNAPVFWVLAALGLAPLLPVRPVARLGGLALAAGLLLLMPSLDGPWMADRLGLMKGDEDTRAYIGRVLSEKHRLGAQRRMWVPGIAPATTAAVMELVGAEVEETERLGWFGISTELSPAAVHLALYRQSGNRERLLRDAHRPMDLTFTDQDSNWSPAEVGEFAGGFDVVISTDPPDLGNRAGRAFVRRYSSMLVNELGWVAKHLGSITIEEEGRPSRPLSVYALRPPVPKSAP